MLWYLWADLCRHTGELWVGSKRSEIIHSLDQRPCGGLALLPVLLVKGSIQGLSTHSHIHLYTVYEFSFIHTSNIQITDNINESYSKLHKSLVLLLTCW